MNRSWLLRISSSCIPAYFTQELKMGFGGKKMKRYSIFHFISKITIISVSIITQYSILNQKWLLILQTRLKTGSVPCRICVKYPTLNLFGQSHLTRQAHYSATFMSKCVCIFYMYYFKLFFHLIENAATMAGLFLNEQSFRICLLLPAP